MQGSARQDRLAYSIAIVFPAVKLLTSRLSLVGHASVTLPFRSPGFTDRPSGRGPCVGGLCMRARRLAHASPAPLCRPCPETCVRMSSLAPWPAMTPVKPRQRKAQVASVLEPARCCGVRAVGRRPAPPPHSGRCCPSRSPTRLLQSLDFAARTRFSGMLRAWPPHRPAP
jgi:hypothetical protein